MSNQNAPLNTVANTPGERFLLHISTVAANI